MAHVLNIVYGSTTINLASSGIALLNYVPKTGSAGDVETLSETVEIEISGASVAALQTLIQSINRAFRTAETYQQKKLGDRVYVEFTPDGAASSYRSEILTGRLDHDAGTLDAQWVEKKIDAAIFWTRRYYWEGAEAQIPLTNGNGTNNTSGLTVYNHDDSTAGDDNYVAIAAADVGGDLPAPIRLEITNNYNSSTRASNFWIAHNILSTPASLTHILEAEAATGGTTTADATCSGGNRKDLSWAVQTEQDLLTWDLSTALLNACGGNYFRLLARTPSMLYADMWCRLKIKMALTTIWEGPQFLLRENYDIQDFGVVQLPPYLVGTGDLYPLTLVWTGQRLQSGTHSLACDFVQLSALDGWRAFVPRGYGLAYQVRLVDDGIEGYTYSDGWSPSGKTGHYVASGQPIQARPNFAQRLYLLHDTTSHTAPIARTLSLKAYYRPRRLTL